MEEGLKAEVAKKYILHWNYRNFCELPEELKIFGLHIQEIYLKWNNVSHLPSWIGTLQHLTNLYLQHNKISSLPDSMGYLTSLSVLDVSHNCINTLPSAIGHLKYLTELLVAHNNIAELPNEVKLLLSLQRLDLSSNLLHSLPVCVCECQALQELVLDNNHITCLPEKIVYLPSLTFLSVCGNHLLYLPMLPFTSSPCLYFNDNPHLNYISMALGYQITAYSSPNVYGNIWDLKTQGCFLDFGVLQNLSHQIIVEQEDEEIKKELSFVFPKSLQHISSNKKGLVPTLCEMAMRAVYSAEYYHKIEMNIENGLISIKMKRTSMGLMYISTLPVQLQRQLNNGPTSLCHFPFCQRPIFTFGTIWVMRQCCINEGRDEVTTIFSAVLFCSVSCSVKYIQWETDRVPPVDSLWQRTLNWYVATK